MGTTTEKLARTKEAKEAIKSALKTRGQTVNDTDSFYSYAGKVLNLAEAGSIKPSGTKNITSNGTHNVKEYENVLVDIATTGTGGITPSGTIEITENGDYDVSNYASAKVMVTPKLEWRYITLASTTTEKPKYEFTGLCLPHSAAQEFDETDWLNVIGDTYSQYTAEGIIWQNSNAGLWMLANTPFILWCPLTTGKPSEDGLVFLDEEPIKKVIGDSSTPWSGYKCYITKGLVLW